MTTGRRAIALTPMETRRDIIVRVATLADELGYEAVIVPEGWGLDAFLVLAEIATRTSRITLATGIVSIWGRTPATLAMSAATVHAMSGGRHTLGLGVGSRTLTEGFHDVAFEHPAQKLRTTTDTVRSLLAGDRPVLGPTRRVRPVRLGQPPLTELPLWLAALGPRSRRVAAEIADGWIPAWTSRQHLIKQVPEMESQRIAAGVRTAPLVIVTGPTTVAAADPDEARAAVAAMVAWYMSTMGDWPRLVAAQGYDDAVRAVVDANPHPHPLRGAVPSTAERLLDDFTAHGTPQDVAHQLERWDDVADIVSVYLPPGLEWELLETTIRAAAPPGPHPEMAPPSP